MDTIALEAHVSKQTLYRYYQNKETLFVAVLEQFALDRFSESGLLALREMPMDSLETLEQTLTVWAQVMIKNTMHPTYLGLVRLLIAELPRFPQLRALFVQAIPQQGAAFLKDVLSSAHRSGILHLEDAELAARLLAGPLLTYLFGNGLLAPDGIPQEPPPEQMAALIRLALHGLGQPGE